MVKNMVNDIGEGGMKIAFSPADELSFLTKEEQEKIIQTIRKYE